MSGNVFGIKEPCIMPALLARHSGGQPARLYDAVLPAVEYLRKMQKCFYFHGDTVQENSVHSNYANLAKQSFDEIFFCRMACLALDA